MSAAVSVAVFCRSKTTSRALSLMNVEPVAAPSWELRAPSSRRKRFVRTGGRNRLQEICERGEARGRGGRRRALLVERAVPEKGELGAMEGEVVDLTMVELEGADHLGRREKATTACAEPAIRGERGVLGEPSGDRGGRDGMPVAR